MPGTNRAELQTALENFLASKDFKAGVIKATRGKRQKTLYVVELMPDTRYRILMQAQVGNKDDSPGHAFLELPYLDDDLTMWRGSEESYFDHDFETKQPAMAQNLRNQLGQILK